MIHECLSLIASLLFCFSTLLPLYYPVCSVIPPLCFKNLCSSCQFCPERSGGAALHRVSLGYRIYCWSVQQRTGQAIQPKLCRDTEILKKHQKSVDKRVCQKMSSSCVEKRVTVSLVVAFHHSHYNCNNNGVFYSIISLMLSVASNCN